MGGYNRIITDTGVIVLFGTEPFSTKLRQSNFEHYKYDWIWKKNTATGFFHARNMPMRDYENISVFSKGIINHANLVPNRMKYNPQGLVALDKLYFNGDTRCGTTYGTRPSHKSGVIKEYTNYPKMVLEYSVDSTKLHPSQKPVDLLRYLIKTYSDEGDTVLDNCMGSGSTGVACVLENRRFIGMELEEKYYEIAKQRILSTSKDSRLF